MVYRPVSIPFSALILHTKTPFGVNYSLFRTSHTHTHTHTHTCIRTHANTYIYIYTYIIHTYMYTYTYVHTYTYMHTYIHTYIHTYTHTHARALFNIPRRTTNQHKIVFFWRYLSLPAILLPFQELDVIIESENLYNAACWPTSRKVAYSGSKQRRRICLAISCCSDGPGCWACQCFTSWYSEPTMKLI